MCNNSYALKELRFWLQIMGDHARFIKNSLDPCQVNLVKVADNFIEVYDRWWKKVTGNDQLKESSISEILRLTLSIRDFKRELLAERLKNKPITSLSPTFYNHMLNELEDFLRVLADLEVGRANSASILGQHLLWSLDGAGHAAIIGSYLDKVEYQLKEQMKKFEKRFDHLYLKAVELAGYFRSLPPSAQSALEAYNIQMAEEMKCFMILLEELKVGIMKQKITGSLLPLDPDHMYREECYYLHKIAEFQADVSIPDCDPGRSRI